MYGRPMSEYVRGEFESEISINYFSKVPILLFFIGFSYGS